ncbi:ASCH domain-containing protein [Petrimonas sulfuriphila]|uniref:ASCH domain-containing protein n=1 Tax=Petrimonas sulfuriphila TaxID=285070 RepID=UPI003EBB0070
MKALSVKQPWSFLICSGIKPIENRTWKCPQKYIGERVLIHASGNKKLNLSTLTREQYNDACDKFDWNSTTVKPIDRWDRSAIIGSVEIVDCVLNHPSIWAEKTESIPTDVYDISNGLPAYLGKYNNNVVYNWVLANPILFDKPILNVKGKLSFWDYDLPEEYETILNKAL